MTQPLSFQDIILRLLDYWKDQGCLVQQPYNVQVGAGTMNPATVLRVLGPEPWNVAYVEPSIRPDDGRFGDNPNRLQMHHQMQVILQPDPGDPQERYLASLQALGIDLRQHDVRFVEDNWESPALGAWGLGWEVWLDGQEITQFTYFQQAGGLTLDPVAVEITYGLDRIALALQGADSVWHMHYGAGIPYEDILLRSEIEHCRYYFEVADVEALRAVYDTYEREARRCLEANLAVPAHDYNLKCSHLFNVLDTRGAIGVTERANYFRRMRNVARDISTLYAAQREQLGHPLLKSASPLPPVPSPLRGRGLPWLPEGQGGGKEPDQPPESESAAAAPATKRAPSYWKSAARSCRRPTWRRRCNNCRRRFRPCWTNCGWDTSSLEVHGTPRRLVVMVSGLAARQTDLETVVKGPPADRAFDADGQPTAAALGFARGKGSRWAICRSSRSRAGAPWPRWCARRAAPRSRFSARRCPTALPASPSTAACAGMPATWPTAVRCAGCSPCTARSRCRSAMRASTAVAAAAACGPTARRPLSSTTPAPMRPSCSKTAW